MISIGVVIPALNAGSPRCVPGSGRPHDIIHLYIRFMLDG
jgi:hypothetical protein